MADVSEPSSTSSSNPVVAPPLRYPTLPPLSRSVEEWLSQSRPATMTSNPHIERPSSSLSESWATLSTSDIHSEDGTRSEQTDIASLIGQNGPDDVASLDEQESASDVDGTDEEQSNVFESQELPPLFARERDGINDSSMTMKAALLPPSESIEFPEPEQWPEVERVELKHTIHILDDAEASEQRNTLPHDLENSLLAITVRQTMTRHSLDLDKPFHVLYVGNQEYRHIILDKIGDVLVSSPTDSLGTSSTESSRYHVVPTSFGAGATPNYAELLPIHVQLTVDECSEAISEAQAATPNTITLKFKNRPPCTSSWNGSQCIINSPSEWTLPDVAFIFISDKDDNVTLRTRHLAHVFMKTHGVPVIVVSEEPLWKKKDARLIPFDYQSLHMCLESRNPVTGESLVLRRYPIDLKTFESIAPGQLNRHLASLPGIYQKKIGTITTRNESLLQNKDFHDSEKYPRYAAAFSSYTSHAQELAPILRLVTLTIVFAVGISLGYSAIKAFAILLVQGLTRSAVSSIAASTANGTPVAVVTSAEGLRQTSISLVSSSESELKLSSLRPQVRFRSELVSASVATTEQPIKPDAFQIQVVGDCHVIIKPPYRSPSTRKLAKFSVKVTRGDRTLPYELSILFDGVYSLRLDREDAHGFLNVTITTNSKPPMEQTTGVDFGTPWLKIANWRKAAYAITSQLLKDINTVQTGLWEVSVRLPPGLQEWMGDVVRTPHDLWNGVESLRRDSLQLTRETRDLVLSRARQLSHDVKSRALRNLASASLAIQDHARELRRDVQGLRNRVATQRLGWDGLMGQFQSIRQLKPLGTAQRRARSLLCRRSRKQSPIGESRRKHADNHAVG
jgi:hypothetical protein